MLKVLVNALFLDDYGFPKCINRTMYTYPLVPYHLKASRTYLVGDNNVPKENSLFKRSNIFFLIEKIYLCLFFFKANVILLKVSSKYHIQFV